VANSIDDVAIRQQQQQQQSARQQQQLATAAMVGLNREGINDGEQRQRGKGSRQWDERQWNQWQLE